MVDYGGLWWTMVDYGGLWWTMVDYGGLWWTGSFGVVTRLFDSINRGQRLSLSGFADRNVQGLHPVVQRCCPQLCAYGYDALQHVMPCQATKHTTVATSKCI